MFGSAVIEVGIGLVFLFCFMSLVASSFNELIESFVKRRARNLFEGIQELFRDDKGEIDKAAVEKFYRHPLIASLYAGDYDPDKPHDLPSYIPKDSFALALLGIVGGVGKQIDLTAMRTALTAGGGADNNVKKIVLLALDTGANNLDAVQKKLEGWFDGSMERVSGWYKRRTGIWLFGIGLAVSILLNVDAITIAGRLMTDGTLRDAIVAKAEAFVEKNPQGIKEGATFEELSKELKSIGYPIGWGWSDDWLPVPAPQGCEIKTPASTPAKKPADAATNAPAEKPGDPSTDTSAKPATSEPQWECRRAVKHIVLAFPGWLITALAIMLGAPFWFDILQKFVSVRSTIKPKEEKKK